MSARDEGLEPLIEQARATGRLALDTEFMGEGRYRTLLCLIQLAVEPRGGVETIAVVDPLDEAIELEGLAAALADPAIQIVVHAGRQDIALLRRHLRTEVTNVFDTQVSAGFAGLGAQSSYDSLLAEVLKLKVSKTASFTRWDQRPLSPEQLAYAREDVLHLLELSSALQGRLRESGRLQWALEECEPLTRASDERDLETIFARLPRIGGLGAGARAVARELVEWREQTAERQNRAVQSVLSDAGLVEVARRHPADRAQLERIRGIGGNAQGRRAQDLLEAVARGRRRPAEPAPEGMRSPQPKSEDLPLVALCESLVRTRAREASLAYELLAARADLQAIVTASRLDQPPPDVRTLRGGEISLSVEHGAGARRVRVERRA